LQLSRSRDRGRRGLPHRDGQEENAGRQRGHPPEELLLTVDVSGDIENWTRKGPFKVTPPRNTSGRMEGCDVVNHYDLHFKLNLSYANKKDLVEYLKGI
jgi:hypothetical protein